MQALWQDCKYTLRQLRGAPVFTLMAVLTLALGLGVTVTVWSVARQVLLAPLPYAEPDRLVGISFNYAGEGPNADETGESATFLAQNSRSFAATALLRDGSEQAALSDGHGHVSNLAVQSVSEGYFRVLGAAPALGRAFTQEEDRPGGPRALVLSDALWRRQFGADPGIVGRTLRLNQESVTVVGVMPAQFRAEAYQTQTTLGTPDAWRPMQVGPQDPGYGGHNYEMWGRLRPGVSFAQAQGEALTLDAALYRAYPKYKTWQNETDQLPHVRLYPLAAVIAGQASSSLLVLAGAVGAVLLLAVLNLAGLSTARALKRGPELALRAALGASRVRLLRLGALEAVVLSLLGAAGALLTARALLPALLGSTPIPLPRLTGAVSSWTVAALAALGAALSAVVIGAPMAVAACGQSSLGSARTAGTGRGQARAGRVLIAVQMSLAVVLLSAASLLLGTFLKLRAQPLGFQPEKLVVFQTSLKGDRYAATPATMRFIEEVLGYLGHAPGVRSASAVSGLPLDSGLNDSSWPDVRTQLTQMTEFRAVTPNYLATMGIPLLAGRGLLPSDTAGSLPVVVISAATAKHWWPGRSPLGAEIHTDAKTAYRIVGVAADVPGRTIADRPAVFLYAPLAQLSNSDTKMLNGWFPITFTLRLAADIDVARLAAAAVAQADGEIPVTGLATMHEVIERSVTAPRFFAAIAEAFAGFAVLLTAIGLFGLMNYQVAQRSREIGIRMALGASRERILRGVLLGSGVLALLGGGAGLVAGALLTPLLSRWTLEYVVGASAAAGDLLFSGGLSLLLATLVLVLVSLAAAYPPARRASRVDPMEALRAE